MTETADTHDGAPRRLHAARCCTVTPPVLYWHEGIQAIVCSECERIYAPVVLDTQQADRDAVIRALVMNKGVRERAALKLNIDRHAVRRRLAKHQIDYNDEELVIPYASDGPLARDVSG